MCGIIGIASRYSVENRSWLEIGRDSMRHRGPDDAGTWWANDGCVGIGHRRLAIIDISPRGHQPMCNSSSLCWIVFNGEIYNFKELRIDLVKSGHVFNSDSDTEVVLAAYAEWGLECLSRLHGAFAFAIYDVQRRRLFLARDRAGEKPLFYFRTDSEIRFASELKGLMADQTLRLTIDRTSLDCYLAEGFVPRERSILRGVAKLPPAHALTFDLVNGGSRIWRYWQLPKLIADEKLDSDSEAQLLGELEQRLEHAIDRQLVADVPVGILLSGGVDSSLITAIAARRLPKLKTFTVRFPGHAKHDETEHARLIARHFNTEHLELEADAPTVEILATLARQFDEPLIDSSMIPTHLVSQMVRKHCTVALGGDGGDELFGGYSHYDRLLRMRANIGRIPRIVRAPIATIAERVLPVGFRGRNWLRALATDLDRGVPLIASYFDQRTRRKLMNGFGVWATVAEQMRESRMPSTGGLLQRAMRVDFESYLSEDILVKVDRASMLHSLEVRAPMLDVEVIEFAYTKIPSGLGATTASRKILLKRLASRLLPPNFDLMRKQGFSIPLASWLRTGRWLEYFRDVLLDDRQTVFCHRVIRKLFAGQRKGHSNGECLFGLLMFELWRREYQVEMGE